MPIIRLYTKQHTDIIITGVGPCAGACVAWGFYRVIKMLEYEMANPGQESASKQEAADEAEEMTPKKETV